MNEPYEHFASSQEIVHQTSVIRAIYIRVQSGDEKYVDPRGADSAAAWFADDMHTATVHGGLEVSKAGERGFFGARIEAVAAAIDQVAQVVRLDAVVPAEAGRARGASAISLWQNQHQSGLSGR